MGESTDTSPAPAKVSQVFGHIPGVPVGATFETREALKQAGVHGHIRKGIHGDREKGAYSILLCGEYEDDEDCGDTIVYVGSGGQDAKGKQVKDQSLETPENKALYMSWVNGTPVRVTRRANKESFYAPPSGYRYDGLFRVDSYYMRHGLGRYNMCFFDLSVRKSSKMTATIDEKAAEAEDYLASTAMMLGRTPNRAM